MRTSILILILLHKSPLTRSLDPQASVLETRLPWPVWKEVGLPLSELVQQAGATLEWLPRQLCRVNWLTRRGAYPDGLSHGGKGAAAEGSVHPLTLHSNNRGMSALLASLIVQK